MHVQVPLCQLHAGFLLIWVSEGAPFRPPSRCLASSFAGFKTDISVIDGNAKNRRLTCAAACRHLISDSYLKKHICVACPKTPLLGSCFCADHAGDEKVSVTDFQIIGHEENSATTV